MRPANRARAPFGFEAAVFLLFAASAAALILWRVAIATRVGPGWDTFAFLANAAEFAGRGYGYTELHRPPLLSLLTAFAFQAGAPTHESVIQWIDGALSLSGIIAFYLLARFRFAPVLAAVAALGLFAVQPLWQYLGSGYTDFPSVAISLWFLLAVVFATEKSPWYYGIAALLFVAAVLTRFTALLILFPGLLWFAMRGSLFRHARSIATAAVLGIIAYLPMGRFYARRFGDALFPFIFALTIAETVSAPGGESAVSAAGPYYLFNLPTFLSPKGFEVFGWIALVGAVTGLSLGLFAYLAHLRPAARRIGLAVLGVGVAVIAQYAGGMLVRQVSLPVAIFLVWRALGPAEEETNRVSATAALDAVMLLALLTYFDFHGHQTIQVPRYFVTMAPSLLYFTALGWWQAVADIGRTLAPRVSGDTRPAWPSQTAAAIGLALVLAFAVGSTIAATPKAPDALVAGARGSSKWLGSNVGPAQGDTIYSDLWPYVAWYARRPVRSMQDFVAEPAYQHELDKHAADYFITYRSRRFDDFVETATSGPVTVLERSRPARRVLPRVTYLGKAWDNYLESVTGFRFFLMGNAGRYGWEGTSFLDADIASELERSDAVAVYDVRWRSRANGEATLLRYLRSGGSIVIDASGNIGELPYELGNTVMFDTVIKRGPVPKNAAITLEPAFAAAHPDVGPVTTAPFTDEAGGPWFGAQYSELPGTEPLQVLASVGGKPLVAMRRVGKGRVYWIADNLVWHAFIKNSPSESRLVRAVFDDAIDRAREAKVSQ